MANRRNTQRTPPPRPQPNARQELEQLRQKVAGWQEEVFVTLNQLLRQQGVLEIAVLSVAQDVEYLSDVLAREGMLEDEEPEDDVADVLPPEEQYEAASSSGSEPDETPEEEAARLIAEAQVAAERMNEGV